MSFRHFFKKPTNTYMVEAGFKITAAAVAIGLQVYAIIRGTRDFQSSREAGSLWEIVKAKR